MARKVRKVSTFSLSFLDIMSCGLGAAVLIFLLLKHSVDSPVQVDPMQLSEVSLLEEEIKQGEQNLVRIRNTISTITDETVTAQGLARRISDEIEQLKSQLAMLQPDVSPQDIASLKSQLVKLQKQKKALQNTKLGGNKAYEFSGDGERQYLTGVRLGGDNVLILLDASASMLDKSIVNIIRRRNMSNQLKQASPKWQKALSITQWIIANLPIESDFQVLAFNTETKPVFGQSANEWYEVNDQQALSKAIDGINKLIPNNGTNLEQAFSQAMQMQPRPDNIFIITDGLPTIGRKKPRGSTVSGLQRSRLFNKAIEKLPNDIPVNTLLLPLEGDPAAAVHFWQLAILSRGSFVVPAGDWP